MDPSPNLINNHPYVFTGRPVRNTAMLNMMLNSKMTSRMKNVIQIYGKDMLTEMYKDLQTIDSK